MKTVQENYDVGVVVGRFQVHELHPGHIELLDYIQDNHDTMIVAVGCSRITSRKNPLPYNAVRMMILEKYPHAIICPIYDHRSDTVWSESLDKIVVDNKRPTERVCLYGSRDGFVQYYTGSNPTQELVASEPFWSGTDVRNKIVNKVIPSPDFRAGAIYASGGGYARVVPTVDVILYTGSERNNIYMVRKHGEDKFRFPGGYVEPGQSFMSAAMREITEEIGDLSVDIQYLGDTDIEDWRYDCEDTIHTTVFIGERLWGNDNNRTDTDEIAEVKVFTVTNLLLGYKNSVVPEHHVLVEMLQEHLNKDDNKPRPTMVSYTLEELTGESET